MFPSDNLSLDKYAEQLQEFVTKSHIPGLATLLSWPPPVLKKGGWGTSIVYGCLNIRTGEWYIGLSKRTLQARLDEHLKASIIDRRYAFHKALAKQQREGFAWFVLKSRLSVPAAAEVERYYIETMKTQWKMSGHTGYNMTAGGEVGGRGVPDEVSWTATFSDYLAFLAKFYRPPVSGGKETGEGSLANWASHQRNRESPQTSRGEVLEEGCPPEFPWRWDGNLARTRVSILSIASFLADHEVWPSPRAVYYQEHNMYYHLNRLKRGHKKRTLTSETSKLCEEFLPNDWHMSTPGFSILTTLGFRVKDAAQEPRAKSPCKGHIIAQMNHTYGIQKCILIPPRNITKFARAHSLVSERRSPTLLNTD